MFDSSKQEALKELLEVLGKGIDLLTNENLDKDLYNAFEKYADSTIKMVNEAYNHNYIPYSHFNSRSITNNPISFSIPNNTWPDYIKNTYSNVTNQPSTSSEYKIKLRNLLQRLILTAKTIIYK